MTASMRNLEAVLARFARIPRKVKDAVDAQLKTETGQLTAVMKERAPVNKHPTASNPAGELKASVVWGPARSGWPLRYVIRATAIGSDNYDYSRAIEFGHRAKDGEQVPAQPFFFPTYRARRSSIRGRISRVARTAMREVFAYYAGQ